MCEGKRAKNGGKLMFKRAITDTLVGFAKFPVVGAFVTIELILDKFLKKWPFC
jgi:hypothetical protein